MREPVCFIRRMILLSAAAVLPAGSIRAADVQTRPTDALDPKVEAILDRQEERGRTLEDVRSALEYIKEDTVLESKSTLKGELRYKKAVPNPLFYIEFKSAAQDGAVEKIPEEWHVFDGRWYIEARKKTQTTIKHEILRPGEQKDVFKLGEGPFPVPFGQKKRDIVEAFKIKLVPPGPDDPTWAQTDHLECTPRPGTDMAKRYGTIHFWIDRKLGLPVKLKTVQEDEGQTITANFRELQVNKGISGSEMNVPKLDFKVIEEPLGPPAPAAAKNP